ncbi:hypothetical protein EVAR_9801_1 [Eumeta japonica]|uniref:Endonuclease/exonuclease/phosphatase domain-containing protein n=1 Tax=Eumeta variegata TaxID=151549 RepID=A0A4C1U710_EUMVA|nr:hypothetical protein EVAR_9801_1 [Eumeta japonica]
MWFQNRTDAGGPAVLAFGLRPSAGYGAGYDPEVNPSLTAEFAAAAMRIRPKLLRKGMNVLPSSFLITKTHTHTHAHACTHACTHTRMHARSHARTHREVNKSADFVAASVDGIHICSCYAPPSLTIVEFTDFLEKLTKDAKQNRPVAIAGDFNSWAVDWGSKHTNARGKALLEAFTTIDVVLLNYGDTPTYIEGDASSILDLIFVSSCLTRGNSDWKVMDMYTASDHNAILWELSCDQKRERPNRQTNTTVGWKVKTFDASTLIVAIANQPFLGPQKK